VIDELYPNLEEVQGLRSLVLAFALLSATATAADLTVASFNVESDEGDTQASKVAETVAQLGPFDILALQEVEDAQAW
jgi:uncharacterized protein YabE (DUF348 family)